MFNILVCLLFFSLNIFSNNLTLEKLDLRVIKSNSLVCVGLDPDISKIPDSIINSDKLLQDKIYEFLIEIINITAQYSCCFKLQKAFYDQFDFGYDLSKNIISYINKNYPDIPVFIDCKIGDIDNTLNFYIKLLFEKLNCDGITVNPYMGDDIFTPFIQDKNKVGIVLVQTSNPGAKSVQDLILGNNKKLWEQILDYSVNRWNLNNNLMVVLSSFLDNFEYENIRKIIPENMPILLVGIGAQGGNILALEKLLNNHKRGVIVNSSRGIIHCYDKSDKNWREKILDSVINLKNSINNIRFKNI